MNVVVLSLGWMNSSSRCDGSHSSTSSSSSSSSSSSRVFDQSGRVWVAAPGERDLHGLLRVAVWCLLRREEEPCQSRPVSSTVGDAGTRIRVVKFEERLLSWEDLFCYRCGVPFPARKAGHSFTQEEGLYCFADAEVRSGWPGPCEYVGPALHRWPDGWNVAEHLQCLHPTCSRLGWYAVDSDGTERILPFCCLRCYRSAVQGTSASHGTSCSGEASLGLA